MPRYKSGSPEGRRVISVKLDGREVLKELAITEADTDEGWIEAHETEIVDGHRKMKMGPWISTCPGGRKRDFLKKRLFGKVEVTLRPE